MKRAWLLGIFFVINHANAECSDLSGDFRYYGKILSCASSSGSCFRSTLGARIDAQAFGFSASNILHPKYASIRHLGKGMFLIKIEEFAATNQKAEFLSSIVNAECINNVWVLNNVIEGGGGADNVRTKSVFERRLSVDSDILRVVGKVCVYDGGGEIKAWEAWDMQYQSYNK